VSLRQERINRVLVEQISEIIHRMKDPRLGFLTVVEAKVAPDLRTARIGISVLGEEDERNKSFKVIEVASGYIRRELGKSARFKSVPALEFYLDEGALNSFRVLELLHTIQEEPTDTGSV